MRDAFSNRAWALVLGAAVALYGVASGLPHAHDDPGVPRLDVACSGSTPGAPHLHAPGGAMAPRACLACEVGPGAAGLATARGAAPPPSPGGTAPARPQGVSRRLGRPGASSRGPPVPSVRG